MHKTINSHILYEASGAVVGISFGSGVGIKVHQQGLGDMWDLLTTMRTAGYVRKWFVLNEPVAEWDIPLQVKAGKKVNTSMPLIESRTLRSDVLDVLTLKQGSFQSGNKDWYHFSLTMPNPRFDQCFDYILINAIDMAEETENGDKLFTTWGAEGFMVVASGELGTRLAEFFVHLFLNELVVCSPVLQGKSVNALKQRGVQVATALNNKHEDVLSGIMIGNKDKLYEYFLAELSQWEVSVLHPQL